MERERLHHRQLDDPRVARGFDGEQRGDRRPQRGQRLARNGFKTDISISMIEKTETAQAAGRQLSAAGFAVCSGLCFGRTQRAAAVLKRRAFSAIMQHS